MPTGWDWLLGTVNLASEVYLVASLVVFTTSVVVFIRGNRKPLPKEAVQARRSDFIGLVGGVLISGLLLSSWAAGERLLPFMEQVAS